MSALELIKQLQLLVEKYGDLPVLHADDGSVADASTVELLQMRSLEPVILIR